MRARTIKIMLGCLLLAGCVEPEQAKQQEAVEYQVQQHDAARCAELGEVPGSDEFNKCMLRQGDVVQAPR